jgi:hypothetical protein
MQPQDIMTKIKDLLDNGAVDDAKQLFEDNKDKLGDFTGQAEDLFKNIDLGKLTDSGHLADKAKEALEQVKDNPVVDKIKDIFKK